LDANDVAVSIAKMTTTSSENDFTTPASPPSGPTAGQPTGAVTGSASERPAEPRASVWGDETAVVGEALEWVRGRVIRPTDPKSTARSAAELAVAAGPTITAAGIGGTSALRVFDQVLAPATRAQDDPLNLAYVPAAPTRAAIAFELVTSAANIFAGLWEAGAGAIYAENEALAWLVRLLGWPDTAGGCFVSGGTSGNLSALVAARAAAMTRTANMSPTANTTHTAAMITTAKTAQSANGSSGPQPSGPDTRPASGRWKLACTADAHSSIRSVAKVMDVDVVEVPEDAQGRLTGSALADVLAQHRDVFAVVASAGTTNAGVVDDLAGIADVANAAGVWMHVDGAYGGAALAAPSVRHLFNGIERADSFIVDPHKWLFAPYDCCALLYRDPALARAAHAQNASYLDDVDRQQWNPSDLAVHLSRRARGLPFWFSLATHGTDRYTAAVEQGLATAREVAVAIDAAPHLRLVSAPSLSVLLFERPGWDENAYREWSTRLAREGALLCVPTRWQGRMVLRLAFVNPATEAGRVVELLATLA
jgi:glutamate/tyrosine decarboxylase-like PLP-dependent enzyme